MKLGKILGGLAVAVALGGVYVGVTEYRLWKAFHAFPPPAHTWARTLPLRPLTLDAQPVGEIDREHFDTKQNGEIAAVAVSYDDTVIASASPKDYVRLMNRASGREAATFPTTDGVNAVAFTHDDRHVLSGGPATFHVFDRSSGADEWSFPLADCRKIVVTKDDKTAFVASSDSRVHILDLVAKRERFADNLQWPVTALALSPDETFLAAGTHDGSVTLYRPGDWKHIDLITRFRPHAHAVRDVAFSPDGKLLATAGDDGDIVLSGLRKDVPSVEADWPSQWRDTRTVAFSPDGKLLVATAQERGALIVIDVASRWYMSERFAPSPPKSAPLEQVAFTHDGRSIVIGSDKQLVTLPVPTRGRGTVLPEPGPEAVDLPAEPALMYPDGPATPNGGPYGAERIAIAKCWNHEPCPRDEIQHQVGIKSAQTAEYWGTVAAIHAIDPTDQLGYGGRTIKEAYARTPRDPFTVLVEARLTNEHGDYAGTIASLGALIRSTKGRDVLIAAWRLLAIAYAKSGDIDAAEAAARKRLALAVQTDAAADELARFFLAINEPTKALTLPLTPSMRSLVSVAAGDEALWRDHRRDDAFALYGHIESARAAYGRAAVDRDRGEPELARKELLAGPHEPALRWPDGSPAEERALAELAK